MKTLLEGLNLSECERIEAGEYMSDSVVVGWQYADNLRKALVAALGVIDTMNADGVMKYAKAVKELETALEPFRKEPSDGR